MDCSPEYIKMCEGAEEIQALAPSLEIGDVYVYLRPLEGFSWYHKSRQWFYDNPNDPLTQPIVCKIDTDRDGGISHEYTDNIERIWLPRQDQLQEMLIGNLAEQYQKLHNFVAGSPFPCLYFGSWEQLWLAFAMKEKFGKTWDGNEWITKK